MVTQRKLCIFYCQVIVCIKLQSRFSLIIYWSHLKYIFFLCFLPNNESGNGLSGVCCCIKVRMSQDVSFDFYVAQAG